MTRRKKKPLGPHSHAGDAARVSEALVQDEAVTRKNFYLHQSKIDMAREILGAKTETEAVETALDMLIFGEALARGTEAMSGEEYVDVLGLTADDLGD